MKNIIKKLIKYRKINCTVYTGTGYIQGMGMDVEKTEVSIFGIKLITDIKVEVNKEWLRNLKARMKQDAEQQLKEIQ